MSDHDLNSVYSPEYLALRAANDRMREQGLDWIWDTLSTVCAQMDGELGGAPERPAVRLARQEWQFDVGRSVMVGQRFGVRFRTATMIVEAGWPRLPQHGFVPDQGLARGRISLSSSPILDARLADDLILKARGDGSAAWHVIRNGALGESITAATLRNYLDVLLKE